MVISVRDLTAADELGARVCGCNRGAAVAIATCRRLVERNGDSKLVAKHLIRLGDLYAEAARQEHLRSRAGLGVIDALKALNIFDHGTLAILAGAERANKLTEGIPQAIQSITEKRKNSRAIIGTMSWLGFDVFTIVTSLWAGKDMVLGWFRDNKPDDPKERENFEYVVNIQKLFI